MKSKLLKTFKYGFIKGIGIACGLCATGLLAASIPLWTETIAPYTPFATNEVITADAFNKKFDALRGAIGDIDPQFSTTETATHLRWTDGKVIYRKTVNFGSMPSSTTKAVAHGITSLASVVKVSGIMTNGTNHYPLPLGSTLTTLSVPVVVNGTDITVDVSSGSYATYSATFVLEYTKN